MEKIFLSFNCKLKMKRFNLKCKCNRLTFSGVSGRMLQTEYQSYHFIYIQKWDGKLPFIDIKDVLSVILFAKLSQGIEGLVITLIKIVVFLIIFYLIIDLCTHIQKAIYFVLIFFLFLFFWSIHSIFIVIDNNNNQYRENFCVAHYYVNRVDLSDYFLFFIY